MMQYIVELTNSLEVEAICEANSHLLLSCLLKLYDKAYSEMQLDYLAFKCGHPDLYF